MRDARTVREAVIASHQETLAAVVDAGRTVAAAWPGETVTESGAVTAPLERVLGERDLGGPLIELLDTGAGALELGVQGAPVPAPPYLAVTSRGPVCRATLADGRRLVLSLELFAVERRPVRYRFRDPSPRDCLGVELR